MLMFGPDDYGAYPTLKSNRGLYIAQQIKTTHISKMTTGREEKNKQKSMSARTETQI